MALQRIACARESHELTRISMTEIIYKNALTDEHRAQLLNYLHATGLELGLVVNFGHYPGLEYERIAKTQRLKIKRDISSVVL